MLLEESAEFGRRQFWMNICRNPEQMKRIVALLAVRRNRSDLDTIG